MHLSFRKLTQHTHTSTHSACALEYQLPLKNIPLCFSPISPKILIFQETLIIVKFSIANLVPSFLSLNYKYIFQILVFYLKTATAPPENGHSLFRSSPIQKLRSCQAPFFENLVRGSTHPVESGSAY